ncbi:MAG: hypothetical protein GY858_08260 [Candidatus Omnitrophica bacterium]|nr:hypothetical protein [Candidatus Omnitrophota bacterium]
MIFTIFEFGFPLSISNIKEARLISRKSAVDCRAIFDRISFCCSETAIDGDLGVGIF